MPNVPFPYETNWQLVAGNVSLTPICSLSNQSLSPSLTVLQKVPDGGVLNNTAGLVESTAAGN